MEELMIVDANANVGPTVYDDFEFEPTLEELSSQLTSAGIDQALVAPLKPPSFDFDRANARLAEEITDHEMFRGIARIDPRVSKAPRHARQAIDRYGFCGIKLHPRKESFKITDGTANPVLEVAADRDVPVWIHAGYPAVSHSLSIREVANKFPDVTFILTHAAQLDISGLSITDTLLLAKDTENTVFELSGVYRMDLVSDLVETAGADRVVFGTNAPDFHPEVEKTRVTEATISEKNKRAILSESILQII